MDGPTMHDEDEAVAAINIVPLVDVILVVLIIFMVTATFATVSALELKLPKAQDGNATSQPPNQIVVSIDQDGTIYVNKQVTDIKKLKEKILSLKDKGEGKKTPLLLQGNYDIKYEKLMPILQEVSEEGIELILAFQPQKN